MTTAGTPRTAPPHDVWIDTDTAIGVPGADIDDGLALIQAFHSPELRVRGVSSIFGNAPLAKTHPTAVDVVARFGPPGLKVARGAASAAERGVPCEAVLALAQALRERPLHVIALGPLTNVASLLELHPDLAPRILSIVMVAARRPGQLFVSHANQPNPFPDLNFDCDPAAMQILLDAEPALIFAPWEVSSHVWIESADLDAIETRGPIGAWVAGHARPWLRIWHEQLGAPGFNPFDTLAIAALSHPDWLERFECGVWIEDGPDDTAPAEARAAGATKPHLLVDPAARGTLRRAVYCFRPRDAFKPMLLDRLARAAT
jgi:inosine-uridine nucleoside N-ribohydrolase